MKAWAIKQYRIFGWWAEDYKIWHLHCEKNCLHILSCLSFFIQFRGSNKSEETKTDLQCWGCTDHQWLRQISMKLPYAVLRKSALKFTKGSKRENSISYYFLLFWFNQNSISALKTLLSRLSEKTPWKVDSESLY